MAGFTCRSYFEGNNSIGPASYRNSNAAAGKGWKMFIDSSNNHLLRNESDVGVRIVDGATAWSASSDERLKDVQGSVEGALDILAPIRPVYYNFKGQDRRMVGVIAQDVQTVLPEAVDVGDDGMLSMRYTDLVPVLVKAIQELTARLEALEA
jgi:hypothetical protein